MTKLPVSIAQLSLLLEMLTQLFKSVVWGFHRRYNFQHREGASDAGSSQVVTILSLFFTLHDKLNVRNNKDTTPNHRCEKFKGHTGFHQRSFSSGGGGRDEEDNKRSSNRGNKQRIQRQQQYPQVRNFQVSACDFMMTDEGRKHKGRRRD